MKKSFFSLCFLLSVLVVNGQVSSNWAKSVGGYSYDEGNSLTIGNTGNLYITGSFSSGGTDFDPGIGIKFLPSNGSGDIFIMKLNPLGELIWAKSIGGTGIDYGKSIVVDNIDSNIYITGYFTGTVDFDPGSGTNNLSTPGNQDGDIFILKLDSNGNFIWAKNFTGSASNIHTDIGHSVDIDLSGDILITGSFAGVADFDPGPGVHNRGTLSPTTTNAFVLKLKSNGSFLWAKSFEGPSWNGGESITSDKEGNVYTTGYFKGVADFDPDTGIYNLGSGTISGYNSTFISKLDSNGNFVWAKAKLHTHSESSSIVVGNYGSIYSTNGFKSISKLDSLGNYIWSNTFNWDITSIALDSIENLYVTGPGHISKIDSAGNLMWSRIIGESYNDKGTSIKRDKNGFIYSIGNFENTSDFDVGAGVFNLSSKGSFDVYIHKMKEMDIEVSRLINPIQKICYDTSENIIISLKNVGKEAIDFSIDTVDITVNQSGTFVDTFTTQLNNNLLNGGHKLEVGDSLIILVDSLNMSLPGNYYFESIVEMGFDMTAVNDVLYSSLVNNVSGGTLSGPSFVCDSQIININTSGFKGKIQWQRLVGGTFVNENGADSNSYNVFIDSTTTFRVVSCGVSYSDTITIHYLEKPIISSLPGDSVIINCGEVGITYLTASTNDTSFSVNWYSDSLSNSPIFIGDTFKFELNTLIQSSDSIFLDTFYVSALSPNGCESSRKAVVSRVQCSLVSDLSIIEINNPTPATNNSCYSNSEKVEIAILNTGNFPIDFSIDTMYVQLNIAGATSLYSSIEVSDNSLNNGQLFQVGDTLNIIIDTIDMTSLGNYKFEVSIKSNSNFIYYNDTIRKNFTNNISGGKLSNLSAGPICGSDTIILNTQGAKGDIIWQRLDGGLFVEDTGIYAYTFMSYLYTIIDSTTTFRVQSCDQVFSDTITIVSNQLLSPPTVFGDTTFGTCISNASAVLTASATVGGSDLYWYRDSLARDYSYIGDTLILPASNTNPYLPKTDTFYVATIDTATGCFSEKAMVIGKNYTKINPEDKFYFISEDFRAGISPNWQNLGGVKWDFGNINSNNIDGTPMVFSMKDGFKDHEVAMLISPEINAIPGTKLILELDYNYKHANDGSFRIDVYDGTWKNILKLVTDNCGNWNCSPPHAVLDISEYINSSLKIRFRFREGDYSNPNWIALDNIKVYSLPFELGSDTAVCNNSNFTLDAGNIFTSYMWNTGDTTQTIKPVPSINEYIVSVTNSFGCTAVDSIYVRVDKCNTQTYLFENFNSGIPSTWTNNAVSGGFDWMHGIMHDVTDNVNASFDSTAMVYFNDDSLGVSHLNNTVELITPTISPLKNFPLLLSFDYNFREIKGPSDYFRVELYDGTNWITLLDVTTDDCGRWLGPCISNHSKANIDITNYINDSLQVKFTYHDANDWSYWAAFDNVHIYNPDAYYPIATINSVDSVGVADSLYVRGWTSGTVAGIDLDSNDGYSFTIIDQSTAVQEGISVYSPIDIENYVLSEGDSLLLYGRVEQSDGLQQFVPDSIVVLDSNKSLPANGVVSTLNESTESQLIRLEDYTIVSAYANSEYFGLFNGTDTALMKVEKATDVDNQLNFSIGDEFCQLNGLVGQIDTTKPFLSGYYIAPMRTSDIVLSPQINLGNDTLVCTSANFSLDAGPGFSSYSWNTGDTSQSIQVSQNDSLYILTAIDANGCKAIDSILVQVDVCAALNENVLKASLDIYPNPSKGIFIIEGSNLQSDTELRLMDYRGKLIRSFQLKHGSSFKKEMDLSSLPKGLYFIGVANKNLFEVRKIVLQ